MANSLTHIAMHVHYLGACIDFYRSYAGMSVVHERPHNSGKINWMTERGREKDFILVLLPGGPDKAQNEYDFSHLGFVMENRDAVDAIADRARTAGILVQETRDNDCPVGYYWVSAIQMEALWSSVSVSRLGRMPKAKNLGFNGYQLGAINEYLK